MIGLIYMKVQDIGLSKIFCNQTTRDLLPEWIIKQTQIGDDAQWGIAFMSAVTIRNQIPDGQLIIVFPDGTGAQCFL